LKISLTASLGQFEVTIWRLCTERQRLIYRHWIKVCDKGGQVM